MESQQAQVRELQAEMRSNSLAQQQIAEQMVQIAREQQRMSEQLERLDLQRDEQGQRRP